MPKIWRSMKIDGGKPAIGRGPLLLGVRVGPEMNADIDPDEDGFVNPGQGGMSVAPTVYNLPPHRLPRRLRKKDPERFANATGPNSAHCWWMGDGPFVYTRVANHLNLRPDPDKPNKHGLVEPDARMMVREYEDALAATQSQWQRWEE
jgi:hypothetical protein